MPGSTPSLFLLAGALALAAGCASPGFDTGGETLESLRIGDDDFSVKPFFAAGLELQVSDPVNEVSNVPQFMRFVPIHPDDGYANPANTGPIRDDSAKPIPLIEFRLLKLGLAAQLGGFTWDLYGDLSVNATYWLAGNVGEINERNYTNAPGTSRRGYGAALTYWDASYSPVLIPGIKSDLRFPVGEGNLILGAGLRSYDLIAETGWDRFDSLERRKDFGLADLRETSVSLGYESGDTDGASGSLRVGANFLDIEQQRRQLRIDSSSPSLFVMIGYEWRW